LIAGLNDLRPHVVHFSGHAGDAALLLDNGSMEAPEGQDTPYDLLARALGATDIAPALVVLNGCDTLAGAEVLLESTAVVLATASSISDLAASVFAAKFYAAIAAAQSIAAAVNQEASPLTWLVSMRAGNSTCWPAPTLTSPSASSSRHPTSTELS
jgi:hypothetical protein